jgi:hypothetical protein
LQHDFLLNVVSFRALRFTIAAEAEFETNDGFDTGSVAGRQPRLEQDIKLGPATLSSARDFNTLVR